MTEPTIIECLTRTGSRLHFAKPGEPRTLCGHAVWERRIGGSWRPEAPKGTDGTAFCLQCRNRMEGSNR